MYISKQDFDELKNELTLLFYTAQRKGDDYVMDEADYLLQKLQSIELKYLHKKSLLKS